MSPPPAAYVSPAAKWTDSVAEAARAAAAEIAAAKESGKPSERAGFIVQNQDGKYAYSTPVVSADHDNFGFRAQIQKGQKMVAIYHNHLGTDDLAQYFSPNDLDVAQKLNIPSYVLFSGSGAIRSYTPGSTKTFSLRTLGPRVASGDALPPPPDPLQTVVTQPTSADRLADFASSAHE